MHSTLAKYLHNTYKSIVTDMYVEVSQFYIYFNLNPGSLGF